MENKMENLVSVSCENIFNIQGVRGYEKEGVAFLNLEDVARGLGFTQIAKSGNEVVRWERVNGYLKELGFIPTSGDDGEIAVFSQQVWKDGNKPIGKETLPDYIPENIFYRLCMKARNEAAEAFQAKVADEVIPAIRKHGAYMTPDTIEKVLADPDTIIRLATQLKEERAKRVEAEKRRDILLHVQKTYTSTEIAKELGMKSAQALNRWLTKERIQFKQNGTWVLYSQYADLGYTEIKQNVLDSGKIVYDRRWTSYGRDFILKKMGGNRA